MNSTDQGMDAGRANESPGIVDNVDHARVPASCQHDQTVVCIANEGHVLGEVVLNDASRRGYPGAPWPISFGVLSRDRAGEPNAGIELHRLTVDDKYAAGLFIVVPDETHLVFIDRRRERRARIEYALADM